MKVLFFTGEYTEGGAERVMSILANSFVNRGIDVELISYYDSIDRPVDYAEVESYAKLDRLLDNGLSEEGNRRLFHSVNIMEIVSLILKGISNVIN